MLEKIVNVSAGSDYKQSSRPGSHSKVARYLSEYHPAGNDTISLSPATAFLSIIGWKLNKVQIDKEKIHIGFSFDNIDFITSLNPGELFQMQRIDYMVKNCVDSPAGIFEVSAKFVSPLVAEDSDSFQVKVHLFQLRQFFETIISSTIYKSNISSDTFEVTEIYTGVQTELQKEFNYINRSLINFLEKFLSIKISPKNINHVLNRKLQLDFLQITKPVL